MSTSRRHSTCVLWSGGKDCFAALLSDAARCGRAVGDAVLVTCAPHGAVFRCHPLGIVERQVAGLGATRHVATIDVDDWEASYRDQFALIRERWGVSRLVTGDVYLEDWLVEAAQHAGLELVLPLRELDDPARGLDMLEEHRVSAVVSGVRAEHHRPGFLGRRIGRSLLRETGLDAVDGFHPLGENGEFHTIVTAFGEERFYDGDPGSLSHYESDGIWSLDWPQQWLRSSAPVASS